jgi:hypothetical protein
MDVHDRKLVSRRLAANFGRLRLDQPNWNLSAKLLSVLSFLSQMKVQTPISKQLFVNRLNRIQDDFHFNQTYSVEDYGPEFL